MPSGVAGGSRPRFEAENGRCHHVCSCSVGDKFTTPRKLWLRGFALLNDLGAILVCYFNPINFFNIPVKPPQ